MSSSLVDRRNGIPGSDAQEHVAAMGGPVARRASLRAADSRGTSVPGFLDLRTRSQQRAADDNDDVQVTSEESPDADVNEVSWTPPRTTFRERRQKLAERQERRRASAEPADAPGRRTTDDITPRRSSGRRQTDRLPRGRRRLTGWPALLLGAFILIVLYLMVGWLYIAEVGVYNRLSYGPTPTFHLDAVVGDHDSQAHPTHFTAMNVHGTIVIDVAPGGDFSKSTNYILTMLDPHAWGSLDEVVVTLEVQGRGSAPNIIVRLQGNPDLSHFLVRPAVSFVLLNQKPGFKVGPYISQ